MTNAEQSNLTREGLEAYLTSEDRELLQQAAEIEGISVTFFVARSAIETARLAIAEHNRIKLGPEDSRAFAESLLEPPEISDRMMAAAAEYKRAKGLE